MIRCDALFFVSAFFFKAFYDSEQAPLSSFAYHTNTRIDCLQKGPTVQPLFSQTGTLVISFFTLSFSRFPLVSLAHFKGKKKIPFPPLPYITHKTTTRLGISPFQRYKHASCFVSGRSPTFCPFGSKVFSVPLQQRDLSGGKHYTKHN